MNRVLHRIFAAIALLSLASTTLADETRPILVVSLKSHQNLIADLEYVGSTTAVSEKTREPNGKKFVDNFTNRFINKLFDIENFKLRELPGVDPERPWGFTVLTDGVNIVPLGFLPITDLEAFVEYAKKYNGDRVQETEDGLYELNLTDTETFFIKLEGDWGYFGQGPHNLVDLPNPEKLLGDLPSKYDMGVRINLQEVPAFLRDMILDSSDRLGDLSPIDGLENLTAMLGDDPGEALSIMLTELDQVTIGGSINAETKDLTFDVHIVPVEGSGAAKEFAALPEATSRFGSLINDDSAVMMHFTVESLTDGMKDLAKTTISDYQQQVIAAIEANEQVATDREREIFGELLTNFTEIATASIDSGSVDMAMRMTGASPKFTLVGGTKIANREPVDAMIRRIGELAVGDPGFESVSLEVAEQDGVAIHAFKFAGSVGEGSSTGAGLIEPLFGDSRQMHVAVGEDAFFFAFGPNGLEDLKTAMQVEEKSVPPMEFVIELKAFFDLLGRSAGDSQELKLIMGVLQMQMATVDSHAKMTLSQSSDGMLLHGESKEGIIKIFAVAFPLLQDTILEQLKSGNGALGLPGL